MATFDVVVIGAGGVGSAALHHLARRGVRAVALERFWPGHDRGSSHGGTRVIRKVYFEHADYVPLLERAYELWDDLAERSRQRLYHETGIFYGVRPGGPVARGLRQAATRHGLDLEELDPSRAALRFPAFRCGERLEALFEPRAGYVLAEDSVLAHLELARERRAEVRAEEAVIAWRPQGSGVEVITERDRYSAGYLVIAAGAWARSLLVDLDLPLVTRRKSVFWYDAPPEYAEHLGCPVYFFECDEDIFYGVPATEGAGLKVAQHTGGRDLRTPLEVDRAIDPAERARAEGFLGAHLPGVRRELLDHAVCLYTMTPDEHFLVDRHPKHPQVVFAAGLSGHGFKFTPVLGEVLAELALEGATGWPVDFLSAQRLAPR